jgi:transcription elongation regulator 1
MNENSSSLDLNTLWVECKNADGRTYFYNAKTRQSTWTKPEGQRVMSQEELDQLLANQTETSAKIVSPENPETIDDKTESIEKDVPSPNDNRPTNYNPYSYPPPSLGMPFGSFPPHLMPHMAQMMQNGFPGFGSVPPPAHLLRFMMPPLLNPQGLTGGKSLEILQTELKKLRVQLKELEEKLVKLNDEVSNWSEFKNPEGRPYFYNSKTTESTWDKPIVFSDIIDVQNQLEHVNKSMYESEKEAKRLESEQSQLPTTTSTDKQQAQQQVVPTPAFLNGFTLEKLDNNEARRFGDTSLISDRSLLDDKSKGKSKPVSTKPIPGTPWCIVWTSDQQVFFFNPTSRTSLWDRPEELKGRMDVDEMIRAAMPQQDTNRTIPTKQKLDSIPDESEPEAKKVKSEVIPPSNGNETNENESKLISNTKESAVEAEAKAAKQRELIPYDTRIQQFREMLAEKQVSAFATWEQELNKICYDQRYLLLTAKERKQEFDRYTHERADEERREKEAKLKLKKKQFRDLLKESNVSIKSTFNEFSSRHSKDERFRVVEKIRDREAWFHEYIQELKTRGKDGSTRHHDKEKLKKDYFSLLKELKVNRNSSWSEIKRSGEHDPRYKSIESSSRREDWFHEYRTKHIDETTTSSIEINEEDLERQREKERQDRIDASIKKRTEEVKEQLSGFQRELDKEREQLKKEKAMENFKALLTDMVRTADAEWKETKKTLRKDPRWEQDIDRDEKERLFEEHLDLLYKKRQMAFHVLLNEHCTLTSTWKDVKKAIKSDPRFEKIFSNERKRDLEDEFEIYMKQKYHIAKKEFKELLNETKLITYKSLEMIKESEEQTHLRDIEKILQKDKRYLLLDVIPEERSRILMDHIIELKKRGTPPPPTASLDRRKLQ